MSAPTVAGLRLYRGLNRREKAGWIAGLTPVQALLCVGLAAPVLVAVSAGHWPQALSFAVIDGSAAVLVVVPVRGRPAIRWCADLVLFQVGVAMSWSKWQSQAAAGIGGPADEPDLPGILARVAFPDGPPFLDQGRVCLIHDTGEARWGATARLTHTGVGMLSERECERLASRLGNLLLGIGHREVVDRMSLLVRTVPDDGTEYQVWRAVHADPAAPRLARAATEQMDAVIGSISVRTELFVTVSGSEAALRRPAQAAGGGVNGRGYALYRVLDGLEDGLKALGVRSVSWLSSTGMAEALRTGFNPAAAAGLTNEHLTRPTGHRAGDGDPSGSGSHRGFRCRRPGPRRPRHRRPGPITMTGSPRCRMRCRCPRPGRCSGRSARCWGSAPPGNGAPWRFTTRC